MIKNFFYNLIFVTVLVAVCSSPFWIVYSVFAIIPFSPVLAGFAGLVMFSVAAALAVTLAEL